MRDVAAAGTVGGGAGWSSSAAGAGAAGSTPGGVARSVDGGGAAVAIRLAECTMGGDRLAARMIRSCTATAAVGGEGVGGSGDGDGVCVSLPSAARASALDTDGVASTSTGEATAGLKALSIDRSQQYTGDMESSRVGGLVVRAGAARGVVFPAGPEAAAAALTSVGAARGGCDPARPPERAAALREYEEAARCAAKGAAADELAMWRSGLPAMSRSAGRRGGMAAAAGPVSAGDDVLPELRWFSLLVRWLGTREIEGIEGEQRSIAGGCEAHLAASALHLARSRSALAAEDFGVGSRKWGGSSPKDEGVVRVRELCRTMPSARIGVSSA